MKDGGHLTERMVDVAHGRGAWTGPETAHLRDCADCAAEWRLTARAAALGLGVEIDAERLAGAVMARLAEQPVRVLSPFRWVVGLAAAAAIVMLALQGRPGKPTMPIVVPAATVLSELDDLTHDELLTVLDALDPLPQDGDGVPESAPLGDLTPGELERVLRSMEG